MRKLIVISAGLLTAPVVEQGVARPVDECPVTRGTAELPGLPWQQTANFYGSEALAVTVPEGGVWPTTRVGSRIAVKVFWWSSGYRPGMESNLRVEIRAFYGGLNDAVVADPINAHEESLGGWAMLTAIDFPSAGCWEITGEYLGAVLTFVVETVEVEVPVKGDHDKDDHDKDDSG